MVHHNIAVANMALPLLQPASRQAGPPVSSQPPGSPANSLGQQGNLPCCAAAFMRRVDGQLQAKLREGLASYKRGIPPGRVRH